MVSHALLLRVVSFVRLHAGLPACKAIQFVARGIVPQKKISSSALFLMNFWNGGEPVDAKSVSCRGTPQGG
jgi:hypothetical protein